MCFLSSVRRRSFFFSSTFCLFAGLYLECFQKLKKLKEDVPNINLPVFLMRSGASLVFLERSGAFLKGTIEERSMIHSQRDSMENKPRKITRSNMNKGR